MTNATLTTAAWATLLWAGTALATSTPQQQCDYARITAWKTYQSCVDTAVAKDAKGVLPVTVLHQSAAFAKCRHAYFKTWAGFQSKGSLTGSTCKAGLDNRFTEDLVAGVVTDNLTGLVWELKDNMDGTQDYTDPHDADNFYTWSKGVPWAENGTAFTDFLGTVNSGAGFGGANGWRLPTLAELQTIMLDFPCTGSFGTSKCICPSDPCVDPALDAGNTKSWVYLSATSYVPAPNNFWLVFFNLMDVSLTDKAAPYSVRAVRGGL